MPGIERTNNRTFILFMLLLVTIVAQVDRMAMAVLIEPIRLEFGLSDTQAGFLLGPAFVVFYALFGIPFGLWADRANRRNIIVWAISLWSIFTMTCGAAVGFLSMSAARMGVAVGEAGANPPAASMIADLYEPHERGTAMGIFNMSPNIGILIGFAAAGLLSEVLGWRNTFFIIGFPGLLVGLVLWRFIAEPERDHAHDTEDARAQSGLRQTLRTMWSMHSVRHIIIASSLTGFVGSGFSNWLPTYFERTFTELSTGFINVGLGLVIGIAGGAGTFLGGFLSDKLAKHDQRWRLRIATIAIVLGWPIGILSLFTGNYMLTYALIILPAFVALFHIGTVWALMQSLVAPRMRGVAIAVLMFITNLVGGGGGPQYVGILSDAFAERLGEQALAYAMTTLIIFAFWAALHFYLASRHVVADLKNAADNLVA